MRIEEAAPSLRALLVRAAEANIQSEADATLLFRGLHVLGASRDASSLAPLLRLLRRDIAYLDFLLGDTITESLPSIVAGLFDGDAEALFGAIADREIDEFVRKSLLGAASFLAWDGRIERDRMVRFLEHFDDEPLAQDGEHVWVGWVEAAGLLGLRQLTPRVERAFREGRIDRLEMELRHFQKDLVAAERAPGDIERFKDAHLGYIDDVLESLDWTRGRESERQSLSSLLQPGPTAESYAPIVNPWRHVGRNDPCPCGSGKKAKKCCLGG